MFQHYQRLVILRHFYNAVTGLIVFLFDLAHMEGLTEKTLNKQEESLFVPSLPILLVSRVLSTVFELVVLKQYLYSVLCAVD